MYKYVKIISRLIPSSGKIHQNQEIYSVWGGACTIKATHYKDPPKILIKLNRSDKQHEEKQNNKANT